jgi:DNA ligase-associated metallophosphoesterase
MSLAASVRGTPAAAWAGQRFTVAGVAAEALPEGALWLESESTLVVSDLHLEKGSAFAARGQMLPPYDTRATLARLAALMARLKPAMVVSLGDSFHDGGGPARMDDADAGALQALVNAADWVWIVGNHDPEIPASLGGRIHDTLRLGTLTLRHEPTCGGAGEIAGHLHPCAKVSAHGRSVRARCFATDGAQLVMPAFGAYTGGLNVRDEAFGALFPRGCTALMLGRARVYAAPPHRLVGDG